MRHSPVTVSRHALAIVVLVGVPGAVILLLGTPELALPSAWADARARINDGTLPAGYVVDVVTGVLLVAWIASLWFLLSGLFNRGSSPSEEAAASDAGDADEELWWHQGSPIFDEQFSDEYPRVVVPPDDTTPDDTTPDDTASDDTASDEEGQDTPWTMGVTETEHSDAPIGLLPQDDLLEDDLLEDMVSDAEIVGNRGGAPSDDPPMIVPVRAYYFSRAEDTLRSISAQFLHTPKRWRELQSLNTASPGVAAVGPDSPLPVGTALALPGDPLPWGKPDPVYLWTLAEKFLFTAWGREPTPEEVVPFWRGLTSGSQLEAGEFVRPEHLAAPEFVTSAMPAPDATDEPPPASAPEGLPPVEPAPAPEDLPPVEPETRPAYQSPVPPTHQPPLEPAAFQPPPPPAYESPVPPTHEPPPPAYESPVPPTHEPPPPAYESPVPPTHEPPPPAYESPVPPTHEPPPPAYESPVPPTHEPPPPAYESPVPPTHEPPAPAYESPVPPTHEPPLEPVALQPPPPRYESPEAPTHAPPPPMPPRPGVPDLGPIEPEMPYVEAEAPRMPSFLPSLTGAESAAPAPESEVVASSSRGLAGTAVGDAMMLWQLSRLRRRRDGRPDAADPMEELLRQSARVDTLSFIEVAMRHLRAVTVERLREKPAVLAVRVGTYGFEVLLNRPTQAPEGWQTASGGYVLELPQGVTVENLDVTTQGPTLCPALVPVGDTLEGPLLLNVEEIGCLIVSGPGSPSVNLLNAVVGTLGSSPLAGDIRIITVGLDTPAGLPGWERVHATSFDSPQLEELLSTAHTGSGASLDVLVVGPGNDLLIQRAGQVATTPGSRLALVGATSSVAARWPWRIHVDKTTTAVVHPIACTMAAAQARAPAMSQLLSEANDPSLLAPPRF